MARIKTWEISDAFWGIVEPLIPTDPRETGKEYARKPGGGRKPKYSNRLFFSAIVYVLRTGIIWNALPREKFEGVSSAMVHRKFQQWAGMGVFRRIWQRGLAEYDAMEGIRLALGVCRRVEHRGTACAGIHRPQPNGSGKKTGQSDICSSTRMASPCHSSSAEPIGMIASLLTCC